jgi:hypothetical protein
MRKKVLLLILLFSICGVYAYSTEQPETKEARSSFSFINGDVQKYSQSSTKSSYLEMGDSGLFFLISGLVIGGVGSGLFSAGYYNCWLYGYSPFATPSDLTLPYYYIYYLTPAAAFRGLIVAGIVLFGIGGLFILIGIPLCIAGYALGTSKTSMFLDSDDESAAIGLKIKL